MVTSCQESIPSYNDLSASEQDYIRTFSINRCKSEGASNISKFKTASNSAFGDYYRTQYWKIELTKDSTVQSTDYLYVWKVDGTTVYFLKQSAVGTGQEYKFYKVTQDFNSAMIDDLLQKRCEKTYSITNSSSSAAVTFTDLTSTEPPDSFKSNYSYSITSGTPLFFMNYNYTQLKKKLDTSGNVTSSTNYAYKITYGGTTTGLESSYTSYSNAKFCIFDYTEPDATSKDFVFPYTDNNCSTNSTGPTNPGTDATMNFDPTQEL